LIEKAEPDRGVSIIDVGGGESTLVDDLVARGYQNISALDVSQTAIDLTKKRLGSRQSIPVSPQRLPLLTMGWLAGTVFNLYNRLT
jgi:hypothetical protein